MFELSANCLVSTVSCQFVPIFIDKLVSRIKALFNWTVYAYISIKLETIKDGENGVVKFTRPLKRLETFFWQIYYELLTER